MQTFKPSALLIITIFASLVLLLLPEFGQNKPKIVSPVPTNRVSVTLDQSQGPIRQEYKQAKVIEHDIPASIMPANPKILASAPATLAKEEWTSILYPELTRIDELENQPSDTAIIELLPMLSNGDPVVRMAAVQSLADMSNPDRLPALGAALHDSNPQIRIIALVALSTPNDNSAVTSIEPYIFDRELEVRLAAIDALANLENEAAVNALAGLLGDPNTQIRHYAVNALGEIGGENAISYLLQARYDPNETIRANVDAILSEVEPEVIY